MSTLKYILFLTSCLILQHFIVLRSSTQKMWIISVIWTEYERFTFTGCWLQFKIHDGTLHKNYACFCSRILVGLVGCTANANEAWRLVNIFLNELLEWISQNVSCGFFYRACHPFVDLRNSKWQSIFPLLYSLDKYEGCSMVRGLKVGWWMIVYFWRVL